MKIFLEFIEMIELEEWKKKCRKNNEILYENAGISGGFPLFFAVDLEKLYQKAFTVKYTCRAFPGIRYRGARALCHLNDFI